MAAHGNGGFRRVGGERVETLAGAAGQENGKDTLHLASRIDPGDFGGVTV
jgi:hypothetical protein